jgi:hypothetical protein
MYFLLCYIGIDVKLPIVVKIDNIGAMLMAHNRLTGVHTRHVDTWYHFIRENIEEGKNKIKFVRSCDNNSNTFTKNVNEET